MDTHSIHTGSLHPEYGDRMITEARAKTLMKKLIKLRGNPEDEKSEAYKRQENLCIQQFRYVIDMHADRYKHFPNYEDLVQEGYISLLSAMKTYEPTKGSFFYWCHRYVKTRIQRSANTHTAIRFPLSYAKKHQPRKENNLPIMVDTKSRPDTTLEEIETINIIDSATSQLDEFHKKVVDCYYGLDTGNAGSINKVCKQLKISREECIEALDNALELLKQHIEL
jgi:RNA polymerase sigma factor (sigma-70 family)